MCITSLLGVLLLLASSWTHLSTGNTYLNPKHRPEIFFDNGVLPQNTELKVYIFKEEIKRIFLLVEKDRRPMYLTVTPCSAPVEWKLYLRHFPGEVTSPQDVISNNIPAGLPATYYGREKETFVTLQAPSGLYMLDINSNGRDTSALVYMSNNEASPYPKLSTNPKVEVIKVRRNRILISWPPSPSEAEGRSLEYCVAANPRMNYPTLCGLMGDLYGDTPPTPPPSIGFGFWWERTAKKRYTTRVKDIKKTMELKNDIMYTCTGRKTWQMVQNLEENKTYYFDIFVVDLQTNASSSYIGTSATTKGTNSGAGKLRENSLIAVTLNETQGYSAALEYSPSHYPLFALWFYVQSCAGPGPIHVTLSAETKQIFSIDVMDIRTVSVHDPPNGTLQLVVSSSIKHPRGVRLWVSRKYHKFPFPTMPADKRVQLFDTLTTCDSVTLAWKAAADEKVRYCIYKMPDKNYPMKYLSKSRDACDRHPGESLPVTKQKILCRRYHRFSRFRFSNVILQKLSHLEQATTYLFQVKVTKFRGKTLSYEGVWGTTRKNCTLKHIR